MGLPWGCQASVSPWRESGWTDETELLSQNPPFHCSDAGPHRSGSRLPPLLPVYTHRQFAVANPNFLCTAINMLTCIPTFRFPSPERKSENPASVARSPTKVIPGLSSTNVLTAASVTCDIHTREKWQLEPIVCIPSLQSNWNTHANTHTPVSSRTRPGKQEQAGSLVVRAADEPRQR